MNDEAARQGRPATTSSTAAAQDNGRSSTPAVTERSAAARKQASYRSRRRKVPRLEAVVLELIRSGEISAEDGLRLVIREVAA